MSEISPAIREEFFRLTAEQVCELLQVKKDWLYDEVQAGRFPCDRVGRQLRFKPAHLRAYLDGEVSAPAEEVAPLDRPRRGRPRKN